MSPFRPAFFLSLSLLPVTAALSLGCGIVVVDPAPVEICQAASEWQLDFPGEAGPMLRTASTDGDINVAAGAFVESSQPGTGIVATSREGKILWQTTLAARDGAMVRFAGGHAVAGDVWKKKGDQATDIEVTALSPQGATSWTSRFGTDDEEYVFTVVPHGDALFIVATTKPYSGSPDIFVARLDAASGAVQWTKTFGEHPNVPGQNREETPFGAMVDPEGRLVVAARRWIDGGGGPSWVFAVDAQGDLAWEYLDTVTFDRTTEWTFIPMKDGGSVVAGSLYATGSFQPGPARVARLDAGGQARWVVSLDDGSGDQQVVRDGFEAGDGSIILAGYSAANTSWRIWKLGPGGSIDWIHDFEEDELESFRHIRPMPDGGFAVVSRKSGTMDSPTGTFRIVRTRSDGEVLWRRTTSSVGSPLTTSTIGYAIDKDSLVVGDDGRILMVGYWKKDGEQNHGRMLQIDEKCQAE
jgi:hypothetical protein